MPKRTFAMLCMAETAPTQEPARKKRKRCLSKGCPNPWTHTSDRCWISHPERRLPEPKKEQEVPPHACKLTRRRIQHQNQRALERVTPFRYPRPKKAVKAPEPELPKFPKFQELPEDIRHRIYKELLVHYEPLQPKLCCEHEELRFHDMGQFNHAQMHERLAITRVSKAIRAESLPVFYSENTFKYGPDLLSYFDCIKRTGRFQWVRHVHFAIPKAQDNFAPHALKAVQKTLVEHDLHEEKVKAKMAVGEYCSPTWPTDRNSQAVRDDPFFIVGGVQELGIFVVMRMLSSPIREDLSTTSDGNHAPLTSDPKTYHRTLTLSMPEEFWDRISNSTWARLVLQGLGIQLKFVHGGPLPNRGRRDLYQWHRRFQGVNEAGPPGELSVEDIAALDARADKMFDMKNLANYPPRMLYRRNERCTRQGGDFEDDVWYRVDLEQWHSREWTKGTRRAYPDSTSEGRFRDESEW